jgi:hypothetical protein
MSAIPTLYCVGGLSLMILAGAVTYLALKAIWPKETR